MSEPVTVTFTFAEMLTITQVASMRRISNVYKRIEPKEGAENAEQSWEYDILGCTGEAALAKWSGRWWSGAVGDYSARDVGAWQVRSTAYPRGRLVIYPRDNDNHVFVLAIVNITDPPCSVQLVGWSHARDGKKDEYWDDPLKVKTGGRKSRPNFFVPWVALNDMAALPQ